MQFSASFAFKRHIPNRRGMKIISTWVFLLLLQFKNHSQSQTKRKPYRSIILIKLSKFGFCCWDKHHSASRRFGFISAYSLKSWERKVQAGNEAGSGALLPACSPCLPQPVGSGVGLLTSVNMAMGRSVDNMQRGKQKWFL